jgi:prepilin-type N-terminal cleavage/methylation domain-containing protein
MNIFSNKRGYTLIELILTIIIVGIIAGVSAQVLLRGIDAYSLIMNRKDALQHARIGMDRMVSELSMVRNTDLSSISDTNISFWDINGNLTNFRRRSQYNTYELYRGEDFLAGRLGLLDFDFYQSNGTSTSLPNSVRLINIELTIQSLGGYGSIATRTNVFPRSFMYTNFR